MNFAGRVAVFGSLNIDVILQVPSLPRAGETIVAHAVEQQFGGKGANQAVAAARQGAAVAMVGAVGDDAGGDNYRRYLGGEGVDLTHVRTVRDCPTGTAHICVDPRGENSIVVNPGANARIEPASLDAVLPQCELVLLQLECGIAAAVAALKLAAKHGVRAMLNASPAPAEFPWGEVAVDTVIVNELECREVCGLAPAEVAALAPATRTARLSELRIGRLVVTQGAEPTLHFSAETMAVVPVLSVQPRDTVGAGDTFAGALAAELAAGREWATALRYANVAAALSTLALGAQTAMPRRSEVERAIRGAANAGV